MRWACIQGHYDVKISWRDNKSLVYTDLSLWMQGEGYVKPDTYKVRIIPPTGGKGVIVDVAPNKCTVIKSVDIYGEDVSIPDGAFKFEVDNCGMHYEVARLFLYNLDCKLKKFFVRALEDYELMRVYKELDNLFSLLLMYGDISDTYKAGKIYDKIDKTLQWYNCEC